MTVFINIPRSDTTIWEHIGTFESKAEAIAFIKEKFGADDQGRICLISEVGDENEDDEEEALEVEDIPTMHKGYIYSEVLQFALHLVGK